jgi:putative holliday junction resolvase
MKILGIDFGSKRIGLAVSDESGKMAFPHSVILNNKSALDEVGDIVKKEKIESIIIGESKDFKGEPNEIMKEIERFKKILEEKTKMPVFFEPEFMTSQQAEHLQGKNEMHDASAATIILQSYLDKSGRNNSPQTPLL